MSAKFGQSRRELVKDVNAGNITDDRPTPVKTALGVSGGSFTQTVQSRDNSSGRLIEALTGAAQQVGAKISKEQERRKRMKGFNAAAHEEGQQRADEMGQSWASMLFGPNAEQQGSEERIVMDAVNGVTSQLLSDIDDKLHADDPVKWQERVDELYNAQIDKYDSDSMRDVITAAFGRDMKTVHTRYAKSRKLYTTNLARETYQGNLQSTAALAQSLLTSGDPDEMEDAQDRIREALKPIKGQLDEPHLTALAGVIKSEIAEKRRATYDIAKEEGWIEKMDFLDRNEVEQQFEIYELNEEAETIALVRDANLAAENGDIETATTLGKALQQSHPSAIEMRPLLNRAHAKAAEKAAQARYDANNVRLARAGMAELDNKPAAERELAYETMWRQDAETRLKAAAPIDRFGQKSKVDLSPEAITEETFNNFDKWQRQWKKGRVVTNLGKNMFRNIEDRLDNPETWSDASAKQLQQQLNATQKMSFLSPTLYEKHFEGAPDRAVKFARYQRRLSRSADPLQTLKLMKEENIQFAKLRQAGVKYEPTDEQRAEGISGIVDAYIDKRADWGFAFSLDADTNMKQALGAESARLFETGWSLFGNKEQATDYAMHNLMKTSAIIGKNFILQGARLDKATYPFTDGSTDRFIQGLNDDAVNREYYIDEYNLGGDFDLRSDGNNYIINRDGTMTIRTADADGQPVLIEGIVLPTDQAMLELWPTTLDQFETGVADTFFRRPAGGSFQQIPTGPQ